MKAKKKPRRRSDSSGGYTLSDIIQSPPAAGRLQHTEELLFLHTKYAFKPDAIKHIMYFHQHQVVFGKQKKVII